jgi:hypothetical protein
VFEQFVFIKLGFFSCVNVTRLFALGQRPQAFNHFGSWTESGDLFSRGIVSYFPVQK